MGFQFRGRQIVAPFSDWTWGTDASDRVDIIAVVRESTHEIEFRSFDSTGPSFPVVGSTTLLSDVAMRDHSGPDPTLSADFTPLSAPRGIAFAGTPCPLAFRTGGGAFDLRLADATNDCVDTGSTNATYATTDDIDGEGTRIDGAPDVGADEAP